MNITCRGQEVQYTLLYLHYSRGIYDTYLKFINEGYTPLNYPKATI